MKIKTGPLAFDFSQIVQINAKANACERARKSGKEYVGEPPIKAWPAADNSVAQQLESSADLLRPARPDTAAGYARAH